MSPFEAVFGREPPFLADYLTRTSLVGAVDDLLTDQSKLITTLHENLQLAQLRKQNQANSGWTDVQF